MSTERFRLRCASRSMLAASIALGLASGLAACRPMDDDMARLLSEPSERHPIGFTRRTSALHVELGPDQLGLSRNQRADVMAFLRRYDEESDGPLRISMPTSVRGRLLAGASSRQVQEIAVEAGVPAERILVARHNVGAAYPAAVIVSYRRPVAVAPVCGDWSQDIGRDHERIRYPQFGCATQRNLALNVANARDLQHPQDETPSSAEQRYVAWTKYVGVPEKGSQPADGASRPNVKSPAPPPPSTQ